MRKRLAGGDACGAMSVGLIISDLAEAEMKRLWSTHLLYNRYFRPKENGP